MIGNDIVDISLAAVQSNWRRRGFLDKLFIKAEIDLILNDEHSDMMLWRLWSMKESAYKADYRLRKIRRFNPVKFRCEVSSASCGEVRIGQSVYETETMIHSDFIHTTAFMRSFRNNIDKHVLKGTQKNINSQSLYQAILSHLALQIQCSKNDLVLTKSVENIPEIFYHDQKIQTLCSLSHHGSYGAFAICH